MLSKMIKLNNLKTATQLHCSTVFHRSTFCHTEFLLTCSEALKATQFKKVCPPFHFLIPWHEVKNSAAALVWPLVLVLIFDPYFPHPLNYQLLPLRQKHSGKKYLKKEKYIFNTEYIVEQISLCKSNFPLHK